VLIFTIYCIVYKFKGDGNYAKIVLDIIEGKGVTFVVFGLFRINAMQFYYIYFTPTKSLNGRIFATLVYARFWSWISWS